MADEDPYAKYLKPSGGSAVPAAAPDADPYSKYLPNQSTSSSVSAQSQLSDLGTAAAPSWGDQLHSVADALTRVTRAATDWPTFGLVDKLFGPQAQADTAAAHKSLGAADLPISMVGSLATGGPELQAASAIGKALPFVGPRIGGMLGLGATGAVTSGVGAYGHEAGWTPDVKDIGTSAAIGGGLGAGTGIFGGVVKPGPLAPAADASVFRNLADAQYAKNNSVLFDAKSAVHPELDATAADIAKTDLTGQQSQFAKSTMAEVNNLRAKSQFTATDLDKAQGRLAKIARSPTSSDQDRWLAPQYSDAIERVLQNGLPQNAPSGYAVGVRDIADRLHGQAKDLERVGQWEATAAVPRGPDVGNQASAWLRTQEGQQFAPPGSPLYRSASDVAATGAKPDYMPWPIKHFVLAPIAGAVTSEGLQAATGERLGPGEHALADLGAGAIFMGGGGLYNKLSALRNAGIQRRALDALRSTISSGAYQTPQTGTLLRNLLQAQVMGAGGS